MIKKNSLSIKFICNFNNNKRKKKKQTNNSHLPTKRAIEERAFKGESPLRETHANGFGFSSWQ